MAKNQHVSVCEEAEFAAAENLHPQLLQQGCEVLPLKNIAVFLYYMECGGVEAAIADLLHCVDPKKYTVDLYLLEIRGEFLKRLPPFVQVKPLPLSPVEREMVTGLSIRETIKKGLSSGKWMETLRIAARYTFYKLTGEPMPAYRAALGKEKRIECDIALDFHGYLSLTTYFAAWNTRAEKRYSWVHCEIFANRIAANRSHLTQYNHIFCVSRLCADLTLQALPDMVDRISVMHNLINIDRVREMAQTGKRLPSECSLSLLTVGRLSNQKGYDLALMTAQLLKESGIDFCWYFCGDGERREDLVEMIASLGLEKEIIMLGFRQNPYSLMKSCDIYVQPSRYEGYAVTVVEASALGCVVVTTNVSGAREEITDGINGFVTEISPCAIAEAILCLMKDPELLHKMRNRELKSHNVNEKSLALLKEILEGTA